MFGFPSPLTLTVLFRLPPTFFFFFFFIPVKEGVVPCAAYLSRPCGILRPFYFDAAGGGDELSLSTDSSHTLCSGLVFIHRAQWKILPTFSERGESPSILSPVLLSRWSSVGPSQKLFSAISGHFTTLPYRVLHLQLETIKCFSLLGTRRERAYAAY